MAKKKLTQIPKEPTDENKNGPVGPWKGRVEFSDSGAAFAPNELLCSGEKALEAATRLLSRIDPDLKQAMITEDDWVITTTRPFDPAAVAAELAGQGLSASPNQVLFSHAGPRPGACCDQCTCGGAPGAGANPYYANPYYANSLGANPYYANGVDANPYYANQMASNPYYANPYYANPYYANPYYANYDSNGERPSSARPAIAPDPMPKVTLSKNKARCFVLDTGFALNPPAFFQRSNYTSIPYADRDQADETGDDLLDPASGHGTFIAGILEQIAPGQDVRVCRVLSTFGYGKVSVIAGRLDTLRRQRRFNDRTILNLSFGGYVDEDTPTLAKAIKLVQDTGAIVVASAGNDGVCRPSIPASLPGVISVGSIEPHGRAPYSNHGPWVRACAPGTNLTSSFFKEFNGKILPVPSPAGAFDPDHFVEWAQWTGTSFAAPVVAAALMRHMAMTGSTAAAAVAAMIDDPSLLRSPGLGTVVNLAPGM